MGKAKILNKLIYLLYAITFFRLTPLVDNFGVFNKVYLALEIVCGVIIVFKILKKNYFPKIILYELPFLVVFMVSTFVNHGDTTECFHLIYRILVFSIILDYELKNNKNDLSKVFSYYLISLVLLNFITIIIYPNGIYINSTGYGHNWILGYKNAHIFYMISSLIFYFIYKNGKTNIFTYLYILICLYSTIISNSSTAIFSFVVSLVLLIIIKRKNINFSIRTYLLIFIILFFMIVIFRVQNVFNFIIEGMLHKNLTFTGRTYIWDDVINLIKEKPILGYGNMIYVYIRGIYTTHNQILDLIYKVGLLGTSFFIIFVRKCINKMIILKKENLSKMISLVIFSFSLACLQEAYSIFDIFIIFVICDNIDYLINKESISR